MNYIFINKIFKLTLMKTAAPIAASKDFNLKDILMAQGILSSDQLAIAHIEQKRNGKKFEVVLIELGFITDKALATLTAQHGGLAHANLQQTVLDPDLIQLIPRNICYKYKVVPLSLEGQSLLIAMADVYDVLALDQVQKYSPDLQLLPVVATENDISKAIDRYYGYDMSFEGLFRDIENQRRDGRAHLNDDEMLKSPTIRLVNAIIIDGIKQGASDIHFQPEDVYVRIRYRIDGILSQINIFHKDYWPAISVRLKIMAEMNIAESRKPQSGRFTYFMGLQDIDCRVSSHPGIHGENFVLRLLDKGHCFMELDQLGLSCEQVSDLKILSASRQGLMIVTGPTGSGKTTTLYALLNELSSVHVNIMTLEEPVEYKLPLIRQTEIRETFNFSFADGIRSILRQDPDIILVGEVRDEETAKMALRAAMTGHLVLTTLHSNTCFGVLPRLQDLGILPSMLAGHMVCAIAQKLVRILCMDCKTERQATPLEMQLLNLKENGRIAAPKGCPSCHFKGYKGRTAIIELLQFDAALNGLLREDSPFKAIESHALAKGFKSLAQRGVELVLKGETTLEEIRGHNFHYDALEQCPFTDTAP